MATSATPLPAVRAAFAGLIDYAGLFPPAQLAMEEAVAEYAAARSGPYAWMLGRFIVPESQLDALMGIAGSVEGRLPLSVIVDAGSDAGTWLVRLQRTLARIAQLRTSAVVKVEALEVQLPELLWTGATYDAPIAQFAAAAAQAELSDLPAFVELPRDERWGALLPGAAAELRRYRLGGKLRCGGIGTDATPYPREVATFLREASKAEVPFKATAGLHHPIRGWNQERGFVMHGFLNVLTAAAFASSGAELDELTSIVEDEDAEHFRFGRDGLRWKDRDVSNAVLERTRAANFVAYGSCSFEEPIADLRALALIA